MSEKKERRSLTDGEIKTTDKVGRRSLLGMLGVGAAGTAMLAASGTMNQAHAADIDNGTWTDSGSCPRGSGGIWTGLTDADNGTGLSHRPDSHMGRDS